MSEQHAPIPHILSGIAAATAALGASELFANTFRPSPGPVEAVANGVITHAPSWLIELGKSLFGTNNKAALIIGTIAVTFTVAAGIGRLANRDLPKGLAAMGLLQLVGLAAMFSDTNGIPAASVLLFATGSAVGGLSLVVLTLLVQPSTTHKKAESETKSAGTKTVAKPGDASPPLPTNPPVARRSFLGAAGVVTAVGAAMGYGAFRQRTAPSSSATLDIDFAHPTDGLELDDLVRAAESDPIAAIGDITPVVVDTDDFYKIDTNLFVPDIDVGSWSLKIDGMVDNELTLDYDDLIERATTVASVTLSCVSNEVGGPLVGNAVWQGVPLKDLLDEAKVDLNATQIASFADGWSCGFPTAVLDDDRTALVAVGMNGAPLLPKHGFPARLVVSGLYGYVSATKWLRKITLTTLEDFDGYWVDKGWSKLGPVKVQSRIDRPGPGARVSAGEAYDFAGVAWAPNIGIERIEVQVDNDDWIQATLGPSIGPHSWRQWSARWTPTSGSHTVRVRATTAEGETQPEEETPIIPDGATGWHTVSFFV